MWDLLSPLCSVCPGASPTWLLSVCLLLRAEGGSAGQGWLGLGGMEYPDEDKVWREGREEQSPGSVGLAGDDGGCGAAPVRAQALRLLLSRAGGSFCP